MELKLKFKQLREAGGDACAPYEVLLNRECTLRELVDCIIKNERELEATRKELDESKVVNGGNDAKSYARHPLRYSERRCTANCRLKYKRRGADQHN